ncbi:MAG: Spy/CpxP family protein refolding chaperone [Ferrovum sp.]|nr:Spy/CpxP family protein refolding chaperone [Ferrovum sp.]
MMVASVEMTMIEKGDTVMKKTLRMTMLLMAFSVTGAYAQDYPAAPPPPNEPAPTPGSHGDPVENAQRHLDEFKQELNLTQDQQAPWDRYAKDTLSAVREIRDQTTAAGKQTDVQPAPVRFDQHIALMRQRLKDFEKMDQALKDFYNTLTPAQKAIDDQHFSHVRH